MLGACVATDIGAPLDHEMATADRVVLLVVANLIGLAVVVVIVRALGHRSDELVLHEHGFVLRWDRVETAFAWDEVQASRTDPVSTAGRRQAVTRFHLVLRDGTRVTVPPVEGFFSPADSSLGDLAPAMKTAIARVLLRSARAAFERGETLRFGDIEVHPTRGLSQGKHLLPWKDMDDVALDEDRWIVIQRRPQARWAIVDPESVDNADLLVLLIQSRGAVPAEGA
jgi:hypothetical protein